MDKSVIQALNGLIPTSSSPLPPELVELAVSLLAQSRSKASSLKVEEEIARSYACAHLACERLKLSLGLPKIQPRPPCPPRIYQKLYKYLDSALTAGARRSGRPPKLSGNVVTPTSSPVKLRTPAKPTLFKASTSSIRASRHPQSFASEVPHWVMPLIRHICKALGAPAAPHHVFAGVSSILTLPAPNQEDRRTEKDPVEQVNVAALVIAVYVLVYTRLSGVSMTPEEFIRQRAAGIEAIQGSGMQEAIDEASNGSDVAARVNIWMREVSSKGWTELDWFANVPEGCGLSLDTGPAGTGGVSGDEREDLLHSSSIVERLEVDDDEDYNVLRPGLGTMMQDRVDYLSERRQHEYQEWKKEILVRIEEMKSAQELGLSAG